MKKSMILVLTLIFVFAFASVAYANVDDWNPAGPTYRAPLAGDSPHGTYLTTGDECEICHSPHQAGNNGAGQIGSTGASYKLLRGTDAASACDYCHTGAAAPAGATYTVYTVSGTVAKDAINGHEIGAFTDLPDNNIATLAATLGSSLDCFDCHSVHGANTVAGVTSVQGIALPTAAILKRDPNADTTLATDLNSFCLECHNLNDGDTYNVAMTTHYMGAANVAASPRGAAGIVGDAPSTYCYSCHVASAAAATAGYKWPHNSYGVALINMDTDPAAGVLDYTNLAAAISGTTMDGNCLMCHSTVGTDY